MREDGVRTGVGFLTGDVILALSFRSLSASWFEVSYCAFSSIVGRLSASGVRCSDGRCMAAMKMANGNTRTRRLSVPICEVTTENPYSDGDSCSSVLPSDSISTAPVTQNLFLSHGRIMVAFPRYESFAAVKKLDSRRHDLFRDGRCQSCGVLACGWWLKQGGVQAGTFTVDRDVIPHGNLPGSWTTSRSPKSLSAMFEQQDFYPRSSRSKSIAR
jgi:hypothetical protein